MFGGRSSEVPSLTDEQNTVSQYIPLGVLSVFEHCHGPSLFEVSEVPRKLVVVLRLNSW
jgi:hypothetical protein